MSVVIVFSKDRPLQLDATLRSFMRHCLDFQLVTVQVIVKASNEFYAQAYNSVEEEYSRYSNITLIAEVDFQQQVLNLLKLNEYVLWLVDDNIFVRNFYMASCKQLLEANQDALGYSLRLGENTLYCYSLDKPQVLPDFLEVSRTTYKYDWTNAECDFGYPLEVSSSLYRTRDLLPLLESISFYDPNSLEREMANRTASFSTNFPRLLCSVKTVTFCNPINKVQTTEAENRAGNSTPFTADTLLNVFLNNKRIDVACFDKFTPNACHQEVSFSFIDLVIDHPNVSVIIPCYNQAHFLSDAVMSIINQTYSNWECIIVNDGSPDDTSEVARQLISKYSEYAIKLIEKPNGGLSDARNFGIRASKGEWILPLDSDDILDRSFLEKAFEIINQNEHINLVFSNMQEFGMNNGCWVPDEYTPQRITEIDTFPYASLYKKTLWEKAGGYYSGIPWGAEDWNFWITCSRFGIFPTRIPEKLFLYRTHGGTSMYDCMMSHWDEVKAFIRTLHEDLYNIEQLLKDHDTIANCCAETISFLEHKIYPKYADLGLTNFWKGLIFSARGDFMEAVRCHEKALYKIPGSWQILYCLAKCQYAAGMHSDYKQSLKHINSISVELFQKIVILESECPDMIGNVKFWKELQEGNYFENHEWYGRSHNGLKVFGGDLDRIMSFLKLKSDMNVVVIGCGYGRETAMIAPLVQHVYGIDVSMTILQKAVSFLDGNNCSNFTPVLAESWEKDIPDGMDFVYCIVVFQHISRELVKAYISGLGRKLRYDGKMLCQFAELSAGTPDVEMRAYEPSVKWSCDQIKELASNTNVQLIKIESNEIPGQGYWHWAFLGKKYLEPTGNKILIACDHFWPSIGGTELFVEEIARRLIDDGYQVDIATSWLDNRTNTIHNGMRIFQFKCGGNLNEGGPYGEVEGYRNLIKDGTYDTAIILGHPDLWIGLGIVNLPIPRPRIVFLPSINAENILNWSNSNLFRQASEILASADSLITVTESGCDKQFIEAVGLAHEFIPHAVEQNAASENFRTVYNIPCGKPLLVMVANFWTVKNHLALLQTLASSPIDWRLYLIGHPIPSQMQYFSQVKELAALDQRISIIEGLPPEQAASAIRDADLVLIPSKGESAGPLVLLQAMSFATPWIATPECNAVNDEAGGVVTPLAQFPFIIEKMLASPKIIRDLGCLGQEHWRASFTWEKVWPALKNIIESRKANVDLSMPQTIRDKNNFVLRQLLSKQDHASKSPECQHKKLVTFAESALAHKYCVGRGLEIGGSAHNPFGLPTLNVDASSSMATYFKDEERTNCGSVMQVDIEANGDNIPLPDASQDFIVSSHVLEHFPNPIKALLEWDRLIKPGGIIFMIVPHKDRTFESDRPQTTLEHLLEDFCNDTPADTDWPHQHYHCWITEDILQVIGWMQICLGVQWRTEDVQDVDDKVGNGFMIVIRKLGNRVKEFAETHLPDVLPKVSVIVPTYNRSTILFDFLTALEAQTYPHDRFEAIICDDGSKDETATIIRSFRSTFLLTYLHQQNSGPAAARNRALAKASGTIVLIMNDDAIAAPELISNHVKNHANLNNQKTAVLGSFAFADNSLTTPLMYLLHNSDILFQYSRMKPSECYEFGYFWTCNISIERNAFIEAGFFDDDFKEAAGEDTELGYRLAQKGYSVLYDPSCRAIHKHAIDFNGFCRRQISVGRNNILVAIKHPEIAHHVTGLPNLEVAEREVLAWYHEHVNSACNAMGFISRVNNTPCNTQETQIQAGAAQIFQPIGLVNQFWLYQGFLDGISRHLCYRSENSKLKITFITPGTTISGGVKIIIEYCNRLAARGHSVNLISMNKGYPDWIGLHSSVNFIVVDWHDSNKQIVQELPDADALIATQWYTAYFVAGIPSIKGIKYYLVQDYESKTITTPENADPTYILPLHKLVVSSWLGELLKKRFGQKSEYIRNAIDTDTLYPDPAIRLRYPAEQMRIGMLWHSEPRKDTRCGLEAFELVKQRYPAARLILFGTTEPEHIRFEEFHKNIKGAEVRNYFSSLDYFISSSWQEGFGLPGLEAIACGVPLVTTDSGGIADYAVNGETALVVPPRDPAAIAQALSDLICDRDLCGRLRRFGLAKVAGFSWDESITVLEGILRGALSESGMLNKRPNSGIKLSCVQPAQQRLMKIAVFSLDHQQQACGHYRIYAPLKSLINDVEVLQGIFFSGKEYTVRQETAISADIIVVQRFFPRPETADFLSYLCSLGKPIIFEIDDLLTKLPQTNPSYGWGMLSAPHIYEFIQKCSAITVSTEELKKHFCPCNNNIYILPNMLDSILWHKTSPPSSGPVVIGYAGTITHNTDLILLEEVLDRIASRYRNGVAFTFMGCATERIAKLPGFSYIQFETTFEAYAAKLQETPIDIMLIPLEDNPFNLCKSNVKWLEYSACGIAGIYADLPPYNTSVTHGETGLLVGSDPNQWFKAISLLVDHPDLRHTIANKARTEVLTRHTIDTGAHCWLEVYREIMDKHSALAEQIRTDTRKQPRFSVIILTWNRAKMLEKCLATLFNSLSSRSDCEIIVGDNGSTDDTALVIDRFEVDTRVCFQANQGINGYRELFNRAKGEFIICIDDDVLALPPLFERQFEEYLTAFPDYGMLGLDVVQNEHTNGAKPGREYYYATDVRGSKSVEEGPVIGCCFCVRRETFHSVGGLGDSTLTIRLAHDASLYRRISAAGQRTGIIANVRCFHANGTFYSAEYGYLDQDIAKYRIAGLTDMADQYMNYKNNCLISSVKLQVKLTLIIPVFNQIRFTKQCLDVLFATLPSTPSCEIIVVDNASSDGTEEYLLSLAGRITVLSNRENMGFATACNQGAQAASGEILLFLNNDTVPKSGWVEALILPIDSNEADICGARLLYPDGRCQHAGIAFDDRGLGYHIFSGFPGDAAPVMERRQMQAVTGACMVVKKKLFQKLGGFDQGFRNGFEDVDLCLRAGELGARILYVPESVVTHYAEQSAGRKDNDIVNMQRFFARWQGKVRHDDAALYARFNLESRKESNGRIVIVPVAKSSSAVSIIIPLFNKVELTRACLLALEQNTIRSGYELLLVDNGSSDGTINLLGEWEAKATVIRNSENRGFAAACNKGAQAAIGKYLLFLNNDTQVTAGWLEPLDAILDNDQNVAAVGSKLLFPDGTIQHAGVMIVDDRPNKDPLVGRHHYLRLPGDYPPSNVPMRMQAVTAACVLVRSTAFEAVGGFDEGYWNGYEDLDLCFKFASHGWKVIYQPASVVIHHESQSGTERFRRAQDNIKRLHERWLGKIKPDLTIMPDASVLNNAGILEGLTGIYENVYQSANTIQETAAAKSPVRYPLIPLVGKSASSILQKLSSSEKAKGVLRRYTTYD